MAIDLRFIFSILPSQQLLPVPKVRICADGRGCYRHGLHERLPGHLASGSSWKNHMYPHSYGKSTETIVIVIVIVIDMIIVIVIVIDMIIVIVVVIVIVIVVVVVRVIIIVIAI